MEWDFFLQAEKIFSKSAQYRCANKICAIAKTDKATINRWKRDGLPMAFDTMQDILHVMGLELKIVRKRHV